MLCQDLNSTLRLIEMRLVNTQLFIPMKQTSQLAQDGFTSAMATERIPRLAKMMKIYVRDIFTSSQKCCLSSYAFALVCLRKINREAELQGIQSGESIFTPATLKPKNTNPSSRLLPSEMLVHRNLIKTRSFRFVRLRFMVMKR